MAGGERRFRPLVLVLLGDLLGEVAGEDNRLVDSIVRGEVAI